MNTMASGVAFSAATKRSPSFSRSSLSTRMTILPLRTSGRSASTLDSLVLRELMSTAASETRAAGDQPHEFGAGLLAVEFTGERRSRRDRVLLLNAAHHHAHM